jgi:APA family basic amino acid/polyamine antiporter
VGPIVAGLAAVGSIRTAWSFSAFTVLVYYALTNLSALRLPPERRLFSRAYAWGGLAACLFLAFWIDWRIWATGLALIGAGLVWHGVVRRHRR